MRIICDLGEFWKATLRLLRPEGARGRRRDPSGEGGDLKDPFANPTFRSMADCTGSDPLRTLYESVQALRQQPALSPDGSRTAKLLAQGRPRMAAKVGEEAIEVAIEAMRGDRNAVVMETADLLYNLVVLLADLGIPPDEIMAELHRREQAFGIAEKLPKTNASPPPPPPSPPPSTAKTRKGANKG